MNTALKWFAPGLLLIWSMPGTAATTIWVTTLSGAIESPPNDSPGTGSSTLIIDDEAMTLHVMAEFSGLVAPTTVAHIHCCTSTPGVTPAGVASPTPTFIDFPANVTSGTYDFLYDATDTASWNPSFVSANGGTPESALAALLTGLAEGRAYLNIHTSTYPGGEIAGFYTLVPLPAPIWLLGSALLLLAGRARVKEEDRG